ncbi:DUF2975 domain-containing protein [Paenibacillus silvisoli]|uniref:DUF2975 domain-containing protein n=1 Tax=Paenibacillus silvisoli TaxID=3110539 RepID=UPI00280505F7|nr:DUF2975 domain-containing protein [Paenibacillus silvisoli]
MERGKTLFLKITVCLMAIPILAVCLFGVPMVAKEFIEYYKATMVIPVMTIIYLAAIPFFAALYQTWKLLSYIDNNQAFTELAVRSLKVIKFCAVIISVLFVASLPFLMYMADQDDAPGLFAIGLVVVFASAVIAVFAAVLQKLLQNAIDIKSENDLTV